jgi:glycosyltransferase involved in cell wall biosynthesis
MNSGKQKKFVFFTLNDFTREGGGTIRMYGILNQLALEGNDVTLISNATSYQYFRPEIHQIDLNHPFGRSDKRLFQGVVGLSPMIISTAIYRKLFSRIHQVLFEYELKGSPIWFLEYLDNTVGYLIKRKGWIPTYYNDLHGIPTMEFKFRMANAVSIQERAVLFFKYLLASILDKKIYGRADGFIFATQSMKAFFEKMYPRIQNSKSIILPYLVSDKIADSKVDTSLLKEIKQAYGLKMDHFVILFAGGFKKTGGMTDLIEAVDILSKKHPNIRLLMIGDGPVLEECQQMVRKKMLDDTVYFVGRTKYEELRTYQEAADLLVCPDKQNVYSQLIIHVKYFDALVTGKVVINGSFPSVVQVNPDDKLSVSFEPSNFFDLADKIEFCMNNQSELEKKYKSNPSYVLDHFTYSAYLTRYQLDWF